MWKMWKKGFRYLFAISQQRAPKLNARCITTTRSYISNGNRYRNSGALFFGFPHNLSIHFRVFPAFSGIKLNPAHGGRCAPAWRDLPTPSTCLPTRRAPFFVWAENGPGTGAGGAETPYPPWPPTYFFFRTGGTCSCGCTGTLINRFGESIVSVNYY